MAMTKVSRKEAASELSKTYGADEKVWLDFISPLEDKEVRRMLTFAEQKEKRGAKAAISRWLKHDVWGNLSPFAD